MEENNKKSLLNEYKSTKKSITVISWILFINVLIISVLQSSIDSYDNCSESAEGIECLGKIFPEAMQLLMIFISAVLLLVLIVLIVSALLTKNKIKKCKSNKKNT